MSEAAPEAPVETPTAPETPAETAPEAPQQNVEELPQWARDALTKANKEAATYRTKVKELEPRAAIAARLEEASKSEAERLQEATQAAQRDAETARGEAIRYRLAAVHGIPQEDFDLLGSGTEEEIEARAQRIAAKNAAAVAAPAPGTPLPRRPGEQLQPGATPKDPPTTQDDSYPAHWLPAGARARLGQQD